MSLGEVGGGAGLLKGSHQCVEHIVEGAGALVPECVDAPPEHVRVRHAELSGEPVERTALGARQIDPNGFTTPVAL